MKIEEFLNTIPVERQELLKKINDIILHSDKTVDAAVDFMMGKQMIIYKADGVFKYGLASVKKHMSLHAMPLYCLAELSDKYKVLFPDAAFQKGCFNFQNENELPLTTLKHFITECSKLNVATLIENLKKKPAAK